MPPSSLHLLITEYDNDLSNDNSSNEDTSDEDEDAATAAADDDSITEANEDDTDTNNDPFSMPPKTAPKKKGASKKSGGRKTTGETINLDTPPRKKPRTSAAHYSTKKRGCYTVNPYAHRSKNKIDAVLHEGGVLSKDAQPQVSLLLGGKTLSIQWKTSEKLFFEMHAMAQGFAKGCLLLREVF
jgi:hypothetical protein